MSQRPTDSKADSESDSGHSTSIRFNRKGDLLASGRVRPFLPARSTARSHLLQHDGTIVIFDTDTSGVARKLRGHTRQVQSLSWSADGRYLLSGGQDAKCILWDLQDGSRLRTVRFEAAIFVAELHPRDPFQFAVALFEDQPHLVSIHDAKPIKKVLPSAPKRSQLDRDNATEKQLAADAKVLTTVVAFSNTGDYIVAGTNRGWLNFIDAKTCRTLFSNRVGNCLVIHVRFNANGRDLAVNATDKVIRTYRLPAFEEPGFDFDNFHFESEGKYQDIVNGLTWNHVAFSSNGEYLVASINMNHSIYVWETTHKSLEKILEGPSEELSMVEWHPHKPLLAGIGLENGWIYTWSVVAPQRWSALAPDFAEVDENVEYVEREDEFDIHPIEEVHARILNQEDEDIDVLGVDGATESKRHGAFAQGDFQMPVLLDVGDSESEEEIVAVGAGQFRRRSPGQGREWAVEAGGEDEAGSGSGSVASPRPRRR
ncbi:MAG: hypothetical protein Q9162_004547 [Coniocarpon cinnabarinum]